jgi:hypothetical protein
VDRWYHANEARMKRLEAARIRHALRLERTESFLEETHPGRFLRRRVEDLMNGDPDETGG